MSLLELLADHDIVTMSKKKSNVHVEKVSLSRISSYCVSQHLALSRAVDQMRVRFHFDFNDHLFDLSSLY